MSYQLTMLAYDMNGEPLSFGHGAPLRLRNETQLGFKQVKCDRERHSRHRSRMRSFCGREQHVNRWPSAGGSSGVGSELTAPAIKPLSQL
jgi:hypothetical protein